MSLRLGEDNKVVPYTTEEVLAADYKFNKFIINTGQLLGKGLLYGAVASVFFVRKRQIIFYSAGFGVGYSVFRTFGTCPCLS